jgi:excisionase family DNA binding protein
MPRRILYDREQAAAYLGVHPMTLHRWVQRGLIPYIQRTPRGKLFFRRQDLEAKLKPKTHGDGQATAG